MHWLIFFAVLLAPVIGSCIAGALDSRNGGIAPGIAMIGGGIAGIVSGTMLGCRIGRTTPVKVILSVVFSGAMVAVCVGMSCFGCMVGGYQMSFH